MSNAALCATSTVAPVMQIYPSGITALACTNRISSSTTTRQPARSSRVRENSSTDGLRERTPVTRCGDSLLGLLESAPLAK
jgi:hypothetical protein